MRDDSRDWDSWRLGAVATSSGRLFQPTMVVGKNMKISCSNFCRGVSRRPASETPDSFCEWEQWWFLNLFSLLTVLFPLEITLCGSQDIKNQLLPDCISLDRACDALRLGSPVISTHYVRIETSTIHPRGLTFTW